MENKVWKNEIRNKKIAEALQGKPLSEEHKIKLRKPKSTTINMKKPKSEEHTKKAVESRRKSGWFKDTEETKRKMRETRKKLSEEGKLKPNSGSFKKGHKETQEYKEKRLKGIKFKPNKPEKLLNSLIKKNNLPFNYVGDGKLWFRGLNHSFNPDFLSKNPKHIIEFFGDYWHRNTKKKDKERLATYSKYGYKTLVIWEHELKKSPIQVLNKIKEFVK